MYSACDRSNYYDNFHWNANESPVIYNDIRIVGVVTKIFVPTRCVIASLYDSIERGERNLPTPLIHNIRVYYLRYIIY